MPQPSRPTERTKVVARGMEEAAAAHAPGGKRAVIYLRVSTAQQAGTDRDGEGFSIPAQREACRRKAEALGAMVVDEYADKGESARSADRPGLQDLLARLLDKRDVDYVIVHKVDRLARNRSDDVTINFAIQKAGAQLVSVSENIDETPSGLLLHGIMSSIAEFYSQNLAAEALKGMTQKAKKGGTPGRAPLGYVNVREVVDGHEIRVIAIDKDRADLIRWAFERYAEGTISVANLADELGARGLTTRGTARWPARPIGTSEVSFMLSNQYYIGLVTFRGAQYLGTHEPLVDMETFVRVQTMLELRRNGEKQRTHLHYLRGTIFCGRCGSRLCFSRNRSRNGDYHEYFFCVGRQQKRTTCDLPYLRAVDVEEGIVAYYAAIRLSSARRMSVRECLEDHLDKQSAQAQRQAKTQRRRIERLTVERERLVKAYVADAIPIDLLKVEQDRITRELAEAEMLAGAADADRAEVLKNLDLALDLLEDPQEAYRRSEGTGRRMWNQAVFERLLVDTNDRPKADLSEVFGHLLAEETIEAVDHALQNHGQVSPDRGSKEHCLVGRVGFEPT